MDLTITAALAVVALATTLLCAWRGAQPPNVLAGPRLAPWRFLMMFAGALFVLMLAHLATLLGFQHQT